tara:strand:- start:632 stop:1867 length:1236 start_codon:yes stop_codon:yes gene_type:complete
LISLKSIFNFRQQFKILTAAFILLLFNSGLRFIFGLMLIPIAEELSWGRSVLSFGVTTFMVVGALALPFYGRLFDKYGHRSILFVAVMISVGGLALISGIAKPWEFILFYGLLFAVGHAGFSTATVSIMTTRWFPTNTGMANSVAISGNGVGQLLMVGLSASLILEYGWRFSYQFLAIGTGLVLLPLIFFLVRTRQDPSESDKENWQEMERPHSIGGHSENSLASAVLSSQFICLFSLYAICGFQDFFVATHVTSFAIDNKMNTQLAGNMLALMGVAALGGVVSSGYLSDRYNPRLPTIFCFGLRILLFVPLVFTSNPLVIFVLFLLYGFTFLVTAPLTVVFTRRIFGLSNFGTLVGTIHMIHHISGGLGAFVGGVVFDSTGTYEPLIIAMVGLSVAGLISVSLLRDNRVL